jgi:hypothetical protein
MRVRRALFGIGLGLLSTGCSLVHNATCVAVNRVKQSCEDCWEQQRNAHWAERAWQRVQSAGGGRYSNAYAQGFKEGFADYLYEGGDGEPPPLPPKKYRVLRAQSPAGYQAAEDWFASPQVVPGKDLGNSASSGAAESGAVGASSKDLAQVVAAWPTLPASVRSAILELIRRTEP